MDEAVAVITGADERHFANSRSLLGSWLTHLPGVPLLYCDFGLTASQRDEIARLIPEKCTTREDAR